MKAPRGGQLMICKGLKALLALMQGPEDPSVAYARVSRPLSCLCPWRFSSVSWLRMSSRMTCSSSPIVLPQYPRAQKCHPVQVRARPKNSRWLWIADWPFRTPTVLATLYCGGMLRHKGT